MERPEIKDKKVLEYVEDLERQLANFKSEKTIAKSYLGLKNIMDQMNEVMSGVKLIIEEIDEDGKSEEELKKLYKEQRKQQQYLEKSLEISDRLKKYVTDLKDLEKQVNPDALQKEVQKGAGVFEKVMKEREGK
jgi:hypothetical protein